MDPVARLKAAGSIALGGAALSFATLAGVMRDQHRVVISRSTAPFEFWSLVITGAALMLAGGFVATVIFVTHRDDDDVAALAGKTLQSAALGCVLAVVYSIYLRVFLGSTGRSDDEQIALLLKFGVVSALPLALTAFTDARWTSSDAAPVCAAAWVVVFEGFVAGYGDACPITAFLLFVPLVAAALAGHGVGRLFGGWIASNES